jgi:DNA-binding protein H-NS
MAHDIQSLSEHELNDLIANASRALVHKQTQAKRDTLAKIKELAASIGVQVEISDGEVKSGRRKGSKVAIKYRDPDNAKHAWSGRGVKPRWLQGHLDEGRSIEEFLV